MAVQSRATLTMSFRQVSALLRQHGLWASSGKNTAKSPGAKERVWQRQPF